MSPQHCRILPTPLTNCRRCNQPLAPTRLPQVVVAGLDQHLVQLYQIPKRTDHEKLGIWYLVSGYNVVPTHLAQVVVAGLDQHLVPGALLVEAGDLQRAENDGSSRGATLGNILDAYIAYILDAYIALHIDLWVHPGWLPVNAEGRQPGEGWFVWKDR